MARVKILDKETAQGKSKEILGKMPKVANIFGAMAHSPGVLEGILGASAGIRTGLDPKLRELAYLLASNINDCAYCATHHKGFASKAGLSADQVNDLPKWRESKHYSEAERAVLEFTEELTRKAKVSGETAAKVKAHLSDEGMVVLTATVALAAFTNRFNHGLDIELEK